MESIFGYEKITDGELILEIMDIKNIINKCPRFAEWLDKLKIKLSE